MDQELFVKIVESIIMKIKKWESFQAERIVLYRKNVSEWPMLMMASTKLIQSSMQFRGIKNIL